MLLEIASLVADAVGVLEPPQEPDLLEDVLPLFERLLPAVRHLLDGDHLVRDVVAGIVHGAEAAVTDLPEVIEQPVGVLALKELRHVRVFQAARPAMLSPQFRVNGAKKRVRGGR